MVVVVTHPLVVAELLVLVPVRGAVHLGDGHSLLAVELSGQLLPRGSKALAVAAPGEENKNTFISRLRQHEEQRLSNVPLSSQKNASKP